MSKQKQEHEFPYWRYHKDHEPRLVSNEKDLEALPGGHEKWHDNPTDAGVKLEVHETHGHQRIRRVAGYSPEKAKGAQEIEDQGHEPSKPEEDLSEASEARLREVLVKHGYPLEKLEKKSKKQLLKMISE
jgi:hypothetical protein